MSFDSDQYIVVLNDEEQYSIWPVARPIPDMRPLSLRRQMAEQDR